MSDYNVQIESRRILHERLLGDTNLSIPAPILEAAKKVSFHGDDPKPFVPTPCKITESSSALTALVAAAASAIAADRYGIGYQDIEVNTDLSTLFLESVLLPSIKGKSFLLHPKLMAQVKKGDLYDMNKPIHQNATNVYKTKDGRYYHLHGSMNAAPTMAMMGVEEQDVTKEEAIEIYAAKVAVHEAAYLEARANDDFKQAGVTCLTPEEFFASEHGKVMGAERLWTTKPVSAPQSQWPADDGTTDLKPLSGIRVIDFSRVIAAPVVSKLLAVLGADVIKITNNKLPDLSPLWVDLSTGKRDADVDLKSEEGKKVFSSLVASADVLIDGYRPGVLERLGFSSETLHQLNPTLVYVRENCYGFKGPLSHRSGWQQISDCLVGISWLQGKFMGLDEPVVPLLREYSSSLFSLTLTMSPANSDYQVGLAGTAAILQALLERTRSDTTFDIDISLTQYNIWYYRLGQYSDDQARELLGRNKDFSVRHYDDMQALLSKTHAAIQKVRPDLFTHPEYFWKMSGAEWGIDEDIHILAPAFNLSKSKLGYKVPSGSRGRSRPEW
ncbi:hypothetical protein F66182_1095 [Fusarium sp. NRRL 66182]|nr:hypothetical protein F66182_1095 [Fusarium sp. NRRL 66182]